MAKFRVSYRAVGQNFKRISGCSVLDVDRWAIGGTWPRELVISWLAMRCPECNSDNPDGAKFCAEGGSKLTQRCDKCKTAIVPGARFCIAR